MHHDLSPHAPASVAITDANTDTVTRYLEHRGIATEIAYLGETEFELGRSATLGDLALIYRVEDHALLICEIRSLQTPESLGSALRQFVRFVLQLNGTLTGIDVVRGILPFIAQGAGRQLQERLCRVYLRRGARAIHRSDGDVEIEFAIHSSHCTALESV
ncbi:hypothetical protein [Cupriavidus pampae]|uniref:Uncharacterized protein n=2 Tax=Cupriavidus pampae TaxID=659251 RepID=A0ABN7ZP37_9BURK|nr:hypothetical protein [Cupriavidus pampae]CAG9185902.1 hypothetical protein LMG32289_06152 [Cupriavidus pampae]